MGLRNLSYAGADVEVPGGGTFTVRGLGPDMALSIYNRHTGQLSELFDRVVAAAQGQEGALADIRSVIASLIADAPAIMAEVIAVASGSKESDTHVEPDFALNPEGLSDWERDIAMARSLPLPVQVDALTKIGEVTFTSAMPPGKFFAVVANMARATTAAVRGETV